MIKGYVRGCLNFLIDLISSAGFALFITILTILFLFTGLFIPQRAFMSFREYEAWKRASPQAVEILERLGLLNVYAHPVLLILFGLLILSVIFCTAKRIPELKERLSPVRFSSIDKSWTLKREITGLNGSAINRLKLSLRKRGFRLFDGGDGLRAVKNPYSSIGSVLFHMSFILIMIGAIISMRTRFTGTLILSEGQIFGGRMEQFFGASRMLSERELRHLKIILDKVYPRFDEGGSLVDISARFRLLGESSHLIETKINRPARIGPFEIYLMGAGYCPLWILMDKDGSKLDGAYVNLVVGGEREDQFLIPDPQSDRGEAYNVSVRFYPDFVYVGGQPSTKSFYPKNPHFYLNIKRNEELKFYGIVPLGKRISLDGYLLELRGVRYWARVVITKDSGRGIIFFSFLVAICGLIGRLLFYRKEFLIITEEKGALILFGSSELFPGFFANEVDYIIKSLKEP